MRVVSVNNQAGRNYSPKLFFTLLVIIMGIVLVSPSLSQVGSSDGAATGGGDIPGDGPTTPAPEFVINRAPQRLQAGGTQAISFTTDSGGNLDYYQCGGVISFDIDLKGTDLATVKAATLRMAVWDVDYDCSSACDGRCERDTVYLNGHQLTAPVSYLTGANDQWSTVTFTVDPAHLDSGGNNIQVYVDTLATSWWCVEVDWGELELQTEAPIIDELVITPTDPTTTKEVTFEAKMKQMTGFEVTLVDWAVFDNTNGGKDFGLCGPDLSYTYKPERGARGNKKLTCSVHYRNTSSDKVGVVKKEKDFKMFFDKDQRTSWWKFWSTPNWYVYWREDGAVPDMAKVGGYDYWRCLSLKTTRYGYTDNDTIGLCDGAAGQYPGYVYRFNNKTFEFGVHTKGIDVAARTVAHEIYHSKVFLNTREGGNWIGWADYDKDGLPDKYETDTSGTDPKNPDTYGVVKKAPGYATYGDQEYMAMLAEKDEKGEYKKGVPEKDWANPGKQTSAEVIIAAKVSVQNVLRGTPSIGTSITGNFVDVPVDTNANGFYDHLEISFNIDADSAGYYSLVGLLKAPSGEVIGVVNELVGLTAGTNALQMKFDGSFINRSAQNGPYTLSLTLSNGAGDETIADLPTAHRTADYSYELFEGQQGRFGDSFSDFATDLDADGKYDELAIVVPVNLTVAGQYKVDGYLHDTAGRHIAYVKTTTNLAAGANSVQLVVDKAPLISNTLNGTLNLRDLSLFDTSDRLIDQVQDAYTTAAYSYTSFRVGEALFSETFNDYGLDSDSDGYYDTLVIEVPVMVNNPGSFRIAADLTDSGGKLITQATEQLQLPAGSHTISMSFDGTAIATKQKNGPYVLAYMHLFNNSSILIDAGIDIHTTQAYDWHQFNEPLVKLTGGYTDEAVDNDDDGIDDVLNITVGVLVANSGDYDLNARLLDQNGTEITWAATSSRIDAGTPVTLLLSFDGSAIYNHGVSGLYRLKDVYVYNKSNPGLSDSEPDAYTTKYYSYAQFGMTATPPGAPTGVTASAGDTQATVTFTPPASDGGSAITSYTVTSSPGEIKATGSASPITVAGLTNGTTYTFTVTATNAIGPGSASIPSNAVTPMPAGYSVSGSVTCAGTGVSGVAVHLSGAATKSTTTDSNGNYSFSGLSNGSYTITPSKSEYTFTPTNRSVTISGGNASGQNFTASTKPGAPTGVSATAGIGEATVAFAPPISNGGSAITSYTVTSNPGNIPATGSTSPITVTGLTNGTTYTFKVRATNAAGTGPESSSSNPVTPLASGYTISGTVTCAGTGVSGVAVNLTGAATKSTTTDSSGNYSFSGLGNGSYTVTPSKTDYTFTPVNHSVTVTGGNVSGKNFKAKTKPGAPTGVTAKAGNASATVKFTAPVSNGGSAITSYSVTSSPGGIKKTGTASPIKVTGLTNGSSYAFTVTATNKIGTGPESAASNNVTPAAKPGAPREVTAFAGKASATVSFAPPASDGGSAITQYTVTSYPGGSQQTGSASPITVSGLTNGKNYRFTVKATNTMGIGPESDKSNPVTPSEDGTVPGSPTSVSAKAGDASATVTFTPPASNGGSAISSYTVTSTPGGIIVKSTKSPITVTKLTNGTTYTFTVAATNKTGTGAPSVPSNPVTPGKKPGKPTGVAATAGNGEVTVSFTAPASDGGSPITSYKVISSPGNRTATGSSSPITVPNLTNGTTYTFTVRAINAIGTGPESAKSNPVTPAAVPGQPTGVKATAGNAQAKVSFTAPASNGGSAITSYTVTASPENITKDGKASPITITGLTNGTAYTFTVTATNKIGTGLPSDPSAPVKPVTVPDAPTGVAAVAGNAKATVSFTAPMSDGGSEITLYQVTSSPGGRKKAGTVSPIIVTGLTNGTAYAFTVKAKNAKGFGAASDPSNSVTPSESFSPTEGLVAYYPFDGNAMDQSGNSNHGTVSNAAYVQGKVGSGLQFTGASNSYVEVPHSDSLAPSQAVTITLWAKVSGYASWHSCLVYKAGEQPTSSGFKDRCYTLWATQDAGVHLASTPQGSSSQIYLTTAGNLYELNEFVHFAGVIDTASHTMIVYINGNKIQDHSYAGDAIRGGSYPLRIGAPFFSLGDQSAFNGIIDEVRIYSRALSEQEIQALAGNN